MTRTVESDRAAPLVCRGIRGATTVSENTAEEILEATNDLLTGLIQLNAIAPEDVTSAIFTTTTDLTATFPALAARDLGWTEVPLLCTHEMAVPGALGMVVRILLHVNTTRAHADIRHLYLRDARALRPEWGMSDNELREIMAGAPVLAANPV
ncbi:MAG: chorismate mutase [Chloroflexota bacterium]|nr:chorismate mutase [Chloroflexota bacterium]